VQVTPKRISAFGEGPVFDPLSESTFGGLSADTSNPVQIDCYVDATLGDDNYDGLYPTYTSGIHGPWKTLAKVNSYSASPGFAPNSSINFKRGETWRERLLISANSNGAIGNPIQFKSYGAGEKPIFSGGALLDGAGNWSNVSVGIWRTANAVSTYDVGSILFNNTFGTKKWSDIVPEDNLGTFYFNLTSKILYLRLDNNPGSTYSTVEVNRKFMSGVTSDNELLGVHNYIVFQDIVFKNYGYTSLTFGNGSDNIQVLDCEFENIGGGEDGVGIQNADGNAIRIYEGATNVTITSTIFKHIYSNAVCLETDGSSAYTYSNVLIYNNLFTYPNCGFETLFNSTGAHTVSSIILANNTFYGCGVDPFSKSGTHFALNLGGTNTSSVTITGCKAVNNIWDPVYSTTTANNFISANSVYLSGWNIDYNQYRTITSRNNFALVDNAAKTLTAWKSTYSKDSHAQTSSKVFVPNTVEPLDLRLDSKSPCVNGGVVVNEIPQRGYAGSAPDIGAIETYRRYSKDSPSSLSQDDSDLALVYTSDEEATVDILDTTGYVTIDSIGTYRMHVFKQQHQNSTDAVIIDIGAKTEYSPASYPIYLQIYNYDTATWETLDTNNYSTINTDFRLFGNVTSNLASYYNNRWICARVYQ
jgi:hypothetical protein